MGQKNPGVVKIIQNLLTCHMLEAFYVSNNFLSSLILYRKQTQKFNFPTDEIGRFYLTSNSHNSAI